MRLLKAQRNIPLQRRLTSPQEDPNRGLPAGPPRARAAAARFLRGHALVGAKSAPRSPSLCEAALQLMRQSLGGRRTSNPYPKHVVHRSHRSAEPNVIRYTLTNKADRSTIPVAIKS